MVTGPGNLVAALSEGNGPVCPPAPVQPAAANSHVTTREPSSTTVVCLPPDSSPRPFSSVPWFVTERESPTCYHFTHSKHLAGWTNILICGLSNDNPITVPSKRVCNAGKICYNDLSYTLHPFESPPLPPPQMHLLVSPAHSEKSNRM